MLRPRKGPVAHFGGIGGNRRIGGLADDNEIIRGIQSADEMNTLALSLGRSRPLAKATMRPSFRTTEISNSAR